MEQTKPGDLGIWATHTYIWATNTRTTRGSS